MTNIAYFLLGAVIGMVGLIVISCCYVSGKCSREEEQKNDPDTIEPNYEKEPPTDSE